MYTLKLNSLWGRVYEESDFFWLVNHFNSHGSRIPGFLDLPS